MSLRLRLTVLCTLFATVVVTIGGWLYVRKLDDALQAATDASLRSRAILLSEEAGHPSDPAGPPSTTDTAGLLTRVSRPDGTVAEESPSLAGLPLLTPGELSTAALHPILATRIAGGVQYRVLAQPVRESDGAWTVLVAESTEENREAVSSLRHTWLVAGAAGVLLCAIGSWGIGSGALRAVDRMRRSVEGISAADLLDGVRVPTGNDELAELGSTFNSLLDRAAQAIARQRQFTADAGHELRGPLAVLRVELELAARPQRTRRDLVAAVGAAGEEVERLARLAEDLLFLARSDDGELQVQKALARIHPVLQQAVSARASAASAAGVELTLAGAVDQLAWFDAERIRHAVDNLLDNAVRAAGSGGHVKAEACVTTAGTLIRITDDGAGFDPVFLPRAFARFTRPDEARSDTSGGTGLGLAIVEAVAKAHAGWASAANLPDGGAEVCLVLPAPP